MAPFNRMVNTNLSLNQLAPKYEYSSLLGLLGASRSSPARRGTADVGHSRFHASAFSRPVRGEIIGERQMGTLDGLSSEYGQRSDGFPRYGSAAIREECT